MARRRQEPKVVQEVVQAAGGDGEVVLEDTGLIEDELFVGTLTKLKYEPGTMSAPAFMDFTLETANDGTVQFEASGKVAAYISLLNSGERLGVFVRDGKIMGVA